MKLTLWMMSMMVLIFSSLLFPAAVSFPPNFYLREGENGFYVDSSCYTNIDCYSCLICYQLQLHQLVALKM